MNPLDPCEPSEVLAVYLIVNGTLAMSTGKIASQAFQAAQRLLEHEDAQDSHLLKAWREQGTRTITKVAPTPELFLRVTREIEGVLMVDEGLTEVPPESATVYATWPIYRRELPRMLRHKRIKLL